MREMSGLSGKAMFEGVESSFAFNRRLRQGSVVAPRMWQKMATQILADVEEEWMKRRTGVPMDIGEGGGGEHQICSFMWADNFWIVSQSKNHLEQMLKDLVEETAKVDLEPKLASLWWTITYASEEKKDMVWGTEEFKILRCLMNRQGKTCDAVEERIQSANKAFWKDIKIFRSKDTPWRIKCRRLVDHVYLVFSFGSETVSWTQQTLQKIIGWETKIMTKLSCLKRQKKETWVDYQTRTSIMARKSWVKMKLPFLHENIAESCGAPWCGPAVEKRMRCGD